MPATTQIPPPVGRGEWLFARGLLVLAAVLWSLTSLFVNLFREPTVLGLHDPSLSPLQLAFFRAGFAGLVLVPIVPWRRVRFRRPMAGMIGCFTVMSGLYLSALMFGKSANAILLQNTSPVWVFLLGVYFLGERGTVRDAQAIVVGLFGAVILVAGNTASAGDAGADSLPVMALGLGSGVMYACVIVYLRYLRNESTAWLTVLNMLGSAACLGICIGIGIASTDGLSAAFAWFASPTARQFGVLVLFGAVQLAAPYWLFARGLRTVSPQEAGIITLLEPVLNPVWAYLIAPDREVPTVWTWTGGAMLMAALIWRYTPSRRHARLK